MMLNIVENNTIIANEGFILSSPVNGALLRNNSFSGTGDAYSETTSDGNSHIQGVVIDGIEID